MLNCNHDYLNSITVFLSRYVMCFWLFVVFPFVLVTWVSVPNELTVVWGATIQQQGMIGAGFAHEAIDFLVPLSSHVYVGKLL